MRKCDFSRSHQEFENWIYWYGRFILKLISARRVIRYKDEKLELMEALVMRCCVRWEVLVEEDVITAFNRDSSAYAAHLGLKLRKHLTKDECEAILIGHRYLDFKSVGDLKGFARRYLSPKFNPFEAITSDLEHKIDEFLVMRNLLAHYSSSGWRSYYRTMKRSHRLQRVREPGEFLIGINPKTKLFQWHEYLQAFLASSRLMLKSVG
jgi:hypothetical protein